jgi:uncharacterized membrane protein
LVHDYFSSSPRDQAALESDMSEIVIFASVDVPRPPDAVWRLVSDYRLDPLWRVGVRSMAPSPAGPVAPGVTTVEILRFGGQTYHNEGLVTSVGPGLSFAWRTIRGADADGARTVSRSGPGRCRVRLDLRVRPRGAQRMLTPLLRWMLRRNLHGDVQRLRRYVVGTVPV